MVGMRRPHNSGDVLGTIAWNFSFRSCFHCLLNSELSNGLRSRFGSPGLAGDSSPWPCCLTILSSCLFCGVQNRGVGFHLLQGVHREVHNPCWQTGVGGEAETGRESQWPSPWEKDRKNNTCSPNGQVSGSLAFSRGLDRIKAQYSTAACGVYWRRVYFSEGLERWSWVLAGNLEGWASTSRKWGLHWGEMSASRRKGTKAVLWPGVISDFSNNAGLPW